MLIADHPGREFTVGPQILEIVLNLGVSSSRAFSILLAGLHEVEAVIQVLRIFRHVAKSGLQLLHLDGNISLLFKELLLFLQVGRLGAHFDALARFYYFLYVVLYLLHKVFTVVLL